MVDQMRGGLDHPSRPAGWAEATALYQENQLKTASLGDDYTVPREVFEYADTKIKSVPLDATERYSQRINHHTAKYL